MRVIFALLFLLSIQSLAHGYIGPGLGAGTIGAIFGLLASVLLAVFALLWYPLKRLLKKFKDKGRPAKTRRDNTRNPVSSSERPMP